MSILCPRCGGLLREDTQFTAEMRAYNCPQRRYVCLSGHSVYVGLPAIESPREMPVKIPGHRSGTERLCAQCGDVFRGVKRQKYCSAVCGRAADVTRHREQKPTGKRLEPDELRLARAMPRPWNSWKRNGTPPAPYATRPTNLSKAWV